MKVVILGVGGMGAISLSKIIAQIAMKKDMSVKSTEIHGMAKKGGLVEIYMRIKEGLNPYVSQGEADFVIVLNKDYLDYGRGFLNNRGVLVELKESESEKITKEFGDIRFANSFVLGKFAKEQSLFDENEIIEVLRNFKKPEENTKIFKAGLK